MLTSKEGCSICSKGKYIICYNDLDTDYPEGRIRWTIAHELGHILCEHFNNNKTKVARDVTLDDDEYKLMEKEANYFASMLLSHSAVLSKININKPNEIEYFCNLSKQASTITFENLKKWNRYNFTIYSDRNIINYFQNYINSKINDYKEHLAFINAFSL